MKEQWDEGEEPEEIETVLKVVPSSYRQYLDVFSKVKAEKPPPHHACDHHIEMEGSLPPVGVIYFLSNHESEKLWAYISEHINLCGAYNLLRIKEGGEHLNAFRTKYGSYEYLVMQLGLANAPASFQNFVNDIFSDFLDIFVIVYLDDIMVFSGSKEEHVKLVASVLQRLRDNNLFAKASKWVFHASSMEYLGYFDSSDGLKMDSSKDQRILNSPQTKNIKAFESFLGFAIFYHNFIKNYSKKIISLTSLFKIDSPFIFNNKALSQFQIINQDFNTAPMLSHVNPSLLTIVETNSSDYDFIAVLSQVID
ncbi:hypothetical protein O181_015623 [Austropuccinia psidii MF-1]|uniref:Reverse transcriptase domain-containing protein n=1 Tax=Austropuccinia psidii MF-1 TaxID=1389203 RepID=A0A9Q3C2T5_9BASI|nr:hypothetical protein [Austropuccinia psidii MF-1]